MSQSKAPVGLSQLFSTMTVNKQSTCYQLAQWLRLGKSESKMGGTLLLQGRTFISHLFPFHTLLASACVRMCGCFCLRTNVFVGFVCWITSLADLNLWSQRDADDKGVRDGTGLPWRRLDFR